MIIAENKDNSGNFSKRSEKVENRRKEDTENIVEI